MVKSFVQLGMIMIWLLGVIIVGVLSIVFPSNPVVLVTGVLAFAGIFFLYISVKKKTAERIELLVSSLAGIMVGSSSLYETFIGVDDMTVLVKSLGMIIAIIAWGYLMMVVASKWE